jgi:hypothetical protein
MEYDPISALQAVGYVEREASFLYLVAVHSGYFLRRQYYSFAGREGGALATRLLGKTLWRRHVHVIECGRGWHIYHLTSKSVYEALNRPDSQHRRIKGDAYIKSRLMVLDFVLAHLNTHVLDNEGAKVEFFTSECGVAEDALPCCHAGRLTYFPDGFPILISSTGIPCFPFFDEGQVTSTRFERYLRQYQPLFTALGEFELTYVADNESNSARAKAIFRRFLPEDRIHGITPMTPLGVDHFLKYLATREQLETKGARILSTDMKVLDQGDSIYTSLEHRVLYSAWMTGSITEDKIRQRFSLASLRVSFSTEVLPYRYPIDGFNRRALSHESDKTPSQTQVGTPAVEGNS